MGAQYEKLYRFDGDKLDDETFNKRLKDIDLRITELEASIGQFDTAVDQLIARGLEQLNTQLQAAIGTIRAEVDAVEAAVAQAEATLAALQAAFEEIISGGSLPASAISVAAIPGVAGDTVQEVLAEHQAAINDNQVTVEAEIEALRNQVNGLGDTHAVADYTEAATLTGLNKSDVVHVGDNGSGKWIRYQVTATGDGTWTGITKIVLGTQDQQPATHSHAIGDIAGLSTALAGKASTATTVTGSGLATGGGAIGANQVINVPKAAGSDVRFGSDDTKAVTTKSVYDSLAEVTLTWAATITPDLSAGSNRLLTMTGAATLSNPSAGMTPGRTGRIRIVQDGTGSRTLAYGSWWDFEGGTPPVLSTAANAEDYLDYEVITTTKIRAKLSKAWS